ncbi:MAG: RDD family protein [Algiphilus sp.]
MTGSSLILPATLWRRLAVSVYDALLVLAICMAISVVATPLLSYIGGPQRSVLQILMVLGSWFYFARSWTRGGQTLGMRTWRVRLRRSDGETHLSLTTASARFFLTLALCILPVAIGGLALIRNGWSPTGLLIGLPLIVMLPVAIGTRRSLIDRLTASEMVREQAPTTDKG